jgi:Flp pilus assembly protein TadG
LNNACLLIIDCKQSGEGPMSNCRIASLIGVAVRLRGGALLRRFARRQEGAAAVEFALVAVPFLALVFAIMETALVFFAGQALETAAADSARLIMTGQAQTQGYTEQKFKEAVCARIVALFNCEGGLKVDVKSYPKFADAKLPKPIDDNGNLKTSDFGYNPGGASQITVLRLVYEWPIQISQFGLNLTDLPGGKRLLMATVVVCNEPFTGTTTSSCS